jgi:hypothetical protein
MRADQLEPRLRAEAADRLPRVTPLRRRARG